MTSSTSTKEAGQQLALFNAGESWVNQSIDLLKSFCELRKSTRQPAFRFEEFVSVIKIGGPIHGWTQPPSPNAYGALPRIACKRGLIRFTGQYENAQSPKTKSHPVKIWEAL